MILSFIDNTGEVVDDGLDRAEYKPCPHITDREYEYNEEYVHNPHGAHDVIDKDRFGTILLQGLSSKES
jgi:hypothetical protein